jgi:hypothetical protein
MQRQLAADQVPYQGIRITRRAPQTPAGAGLLGLGTEQQAVRQMLQPGPSGVA